MRLAVPLVLLLAGCGGPAEDPAANAPAATTPVGYSAVQQRVLGLQPRLRDGVFIRAIRDGDAPCQGITEALRQEDAPQGPAWTAVCSDGPAYYLVVDRNGTAQVTKIAADRRRPQG